MFGGYLCFLNETLDKVYCNQLRNCNSTNRKKIHSTLLQSIQKLYNHFYNILRLLMFCQIFLSPQVKRCAIITHKHGIYQLPHELPNGLRFRILGNQEVSGKCLNPKNDSLVSTHSPCQNENFINTSKKLLKNRNKTFPNITSNCNNTGNA